MSARWLPTLPLLLGCSLTLTGCLAPTARPLPGLDRSIARAGSGREASLGEHVLALIQGRGGREQVLLIDLQRGLPLPLPGRHNALNWLAAIAVMVALGLDWKGLAQGLTVELPAGRARRIPLGEDIVLLDETYNAGFESMSAALQLLAQTPGQRHIAVLGTMKELGDRSVDLHRRLGAVVEQLGIDQLLILADPEEALALVDQPLFIPMTGMVQSLNVSVAAATLLFEALRQREQAGVLPQAGEGVPGGEARYRSILFEWA